MSPKAQQIQGTLLAEGWRIYPDQFRPNDTMFCKKFPGWPKCACNEPKDKQLEIHFHPPEKIGNQVLPESWSVHNVGELPNGQWFRARIEGLKTRTELETATLIILHAWQAAVMSTPPTA